MGNTAISSVSAPTSIPYGSTADVIVTGTLTATSTTQPADTDVVVVSLKTACCSPQVVSPPQQLTWTEDSSPANTWSAPISVTFSNLALPPGDYEFEINFAGDTTLCPPLDPACYTQRFCVCDASGEEPVTTSCNPCSDPISTLNRVMRDRTVSDAVSELLQGAADKGLSNSLNNPAGPLVQKALTTLSKAFAGTDAVRAKGECCHGQLHLEIYVRDSMSGRYELLRRELRQNIDVQLIDGNNNLASNTRSRDDREDLFSEVEAGQVTVAFPSEIVEGAELSDYYEVRTPGDTEFRGYTRAPIEQSATTGSSAGSTGAAPSAAKKGAMAGLEEDVKDLFRKKKTGGKIPPLSAAIGPDRTNSARLDNVPEDAEETPTPTPGIFTAGIWRGGDTTMRCFLDPPPAQVRCFSLLEGEGCGCLPGKQFISCVAISVWRGDRRVVCNPTGNSGCTGFRLSPGWYTFTAPEEVTIEGCNYGLASSSPISAFLGTGQCCSDIYFRYKKKGNEIEVISQICYPDADNPYVEATNNFAGMSYLLIGENNPDFVPQELTTADGGALCFRNLAAGAYLLFCQAPSTFGTQPVQPVYPKNGRLALTVFGGQTTRVPVLVKFRACNTTPAVLDGISRDDEGEVVPKQLVRVLNDAGRVVAAGVTDENGIYSIQIYDAENLTIAIGSQQTAVSKSDIQADMKQVGTPPLPSPRRTLQGALQRSELVSAFRE
jgi:hypothetical protein